MRDPEFPLTMLGDERGQLAVLEQGINVPFDIKRVYHIFGTQPGVRRGFHAHIELQQLAVCTSGQCTILLDDGNEQRHIKLTRPDQGLLIDPMVWHEMYDFSDGCVLMVLANDLYDESDYIRDYDTFMKRVSL